MANFRLSNAPVVEVVIGVQLNAHPLDSHFIYNFYEEIKEQYPLTTYNPPLPIIFQDGLRGFTGELAQFDVRTFFISLNRDKLVQIQSNKILFNWRKTDNESEYPHFKNVLEKFMEIFNKIQQKRHLFQFINQLEVTYFDHFYLEDFNINNFNPQPILNIFNINRDISNLEYLITYPQKELKAEVIVDIKSGINNENQKKLFSMETTCRGFNSEIPLEIWFDKAHKELLDIFWETTTETAKQKWGHKL